MRSRCGATGCPKEPEVSCGYCGIPLCLDHAQRNEDGLGVQYFCRDCFVYLTSSGLMSEAEGRRLRPNVLVVNSEKCIGCRTCELVCSFARTGVFDPTRSRIAIRVDEALASYEPVICLQCAEPACVPACPNGALTQDRTGRVAVEASKCDGCGLCAQACPHGAITVPESGGPALVCDLCGGSPSCAENCPTRAIEWVKKHSYGVRGHTLVARLTLKGA